MGSFDITRIFSKETNAISVQLAVKLATSLIAMVWASGEEAWESMWYWVFHRGLTGSLGNVMVNKDCRFWHDYDGFYLLSLLARK